MAAAETPGLTKFWGTRREGWLLLSVRSLQAVSVVSGDPVLNKRFWGSQMKASRWS